MRKTKSEGKTVGILIGLRNSHCEIGIANFAMRNWHCENSHCEISQCEIVASEFRIAKKLPMRIFCFAFSLLIFNIYSKICTKLLKLKQEKLHKGTN